MVQTVEQLRVFQYALHAAHEVSAIVERDTFAHDFRLRDQLRASSERVVSLIAEGSQQSTDRHYAEYLYRARGSSREVRTQLLVAVGRRYVTESERVGLADQYEAIARMLTGLIAHLHAEDRKFRP